MTKTSAVKTEVYTEEISVREKRRIIEGVSSWVIKWEE